MGRLCDAQRVRPRAVGNEPTARRTKQIHQPVTAEFLAYEFRFPLVHGSWEASSVTQGKRNAPGFGGMQGGRDLMIG
jgi:hypothetical protein